MWTRGDRTESWRFILFIVCVQHMTWLKIWCRLPKLGVVLSYQPRVASTFWKWILSMGKPVDWGSRLYDYNARSVFLRPHSSLIVRGALRLLVATTWGSLAKLSKAFRVVFIVAIADPWVPWTQKKVGPSAVTLGLVRPLRRYLKIYLNYVSVSMIEYPF